MYLIRGLQNIKLYKQKFANSQICATIGNFDGLHIGHQHILSAIKKHAEEKNFSTMVFFTEPHASEYFSNNHSAADIPTRICPWREKFELLQDFGIDFAFFLKFNLSLTKMTPEDFISQVLERVNLEYLQVGDDFRFGKDRTGDYEMLKDWGVDKNISVSATPTVKINERRVSSTWIREALAKSEFELAEELLGRPYTFSGKVVYGNQLGRTIGIPTANLWMPKQRLPVQGVFAVKCKLVDKHLYGIANMGTRPTVDGESPVLEVHLFDFDQNIYGQRLEIEFIKKIRDERKFDNINLLKQQIHKDIDIAKDTLKLI